MKILKNQIGIEGIIGRCGQREVFLGFAPARLLYSISFVDLLNEETGKGYQRRFNDKHSIDFRKYIQATGSSTIPLTFNLRPRRDAAWTLNRTKAGRATLLVQSNSEKVLAQVDCQHRLGHLFDLGVTLAFMSFIGLSAEEEMQIFTVINSKAKGLNSSLLDFNDARLANDLGKEKPELLIAIHLNDNINSPWCKQLDLGGSCTSGITRRASLRTIQKAVKRFLQKTEALKQKNSQELAEIVRHFWNAVAIVLETQWAQPRKHFLTKGIGVYSLMNLAADLYVEASRAHVECTQVYFVSALSEFISQFDWTTSGPMKGLGGQTGVNKATSLLKQLRRKKKLKVVSGGR
jgi:DGQHR domain-containing protein